MTALNFNSRLHQSDQEIVAAQAARTHSGQAHFAGTGPAGTTCNQCVSWQDFGTKKLKARCKKFQQLSMRAGMEFPGSAASCKHFEVRR